MTTIDKTTAPKFVKRYAQNDSREPLNQNLQPDVQKINATIKKITEKRAQPSELQRLDEACNRLKSAIRMQIRQGV